MSEVHTNTATATLSDGQTSGLTLNIASLIRRVPNSPSGTPMTIPRIATRAAAPTTSLVTVPGSAPSAVRSPNSAVRYAVE